MGWITAAIAGAGLVSDLIGGNKSKKAAKRLRREQLRMHDLTTERNLRMQELKGEQTKGQARASAYASGVLNTGSTRRYQDVLSARISEDLRWAKTAAAQERKVIQAGGKLASSQINAQMTSSLLSGAGDIASAIDWDKIFD